MDNCPPENNIESVNKPIKFSKHKSHIFIAYANIAIIKSPASVPTTVTNMVTP